MVKTKLIYIIGSIIIGFLSVIGVFFGLTATGVINTEQAKIVIATSSAEKVYDGTALVCQDWTIVDGELNKGHTVNVLVTSSLKDVGDCENLFTVTVRDHVGANVTEDYVIEKQPGNLKVTPRPITVITKSAEKMYDGTPLVRSDWELSQETSIVEGHALRVSVTGEMVDAGVATNTATVEIFTKDEQDVTRNYEINRVFGTLEVKPLPITIYTGAATQVYDGTPLTNETWTLSDETPLMQGHTLSVTTIGSITEVGEIDNLADALIETTTTDVTKNYKINWQYGKLNVLPCPLTVFTQSANKTYDGTPLTCEESWSEGNLLEGHEIKCIFMSTITEVGSVQNYAFVRVYKGNTDVSYNYEIEEKFGTLRINPREITVRSASDEKEYDGTPLICHQYEVVSVLKVLAEHELYVTVSGEQLSVGVSDNTFGQIYIAASNGKGGEIDVTKNYIIVEQLGTLVVKAQQSGNMNMENPSNGLKDSGTDNSDALALKVRSDYTTALYLREASYGDYNGQGWGQGVTYTQLIDNEYSYNYLFSILTKKAQLPVHSVEIESSYTYVLPYYMEMAKANYQVQTNDVAYSGDTSSVYSLYYYDYNFAEKGVAGLYGVNLGAYAQAAADYETFVRSHYLSVPNETRAYLEGIIGTQSFKANDTNIIAKVARYIQGSAKYDLKYDKTMDNQSDIVVSFLRDYKTGVCRHYAAAATLLYRTLGIPARYVTGFYADAKANEWTEVKWAQYHAWVEVYVSGYGWVQVEVTGGSFDNGNDDNLGGGSDGSGGSGGSGGVTDPKVLTITPITIAVQFDGTSVALAKDQVKFNANFKEGYTYEAKVIGERTELGKGESTIIAFKLYNESGKLVYEYADGEELLNTEEWKITFKKGVLHVYLKKLTFTSSSYSKVYDGEVLSSGGEYQWTGELETGHTLKEVIFQEKIKDVGTVANTFKVVIVDEFGKDVTDWYLVEKIVGQLTIQHREIKIKAGDRTVKYSANMGKITCSDYTVSSTQNPGEPLVQGEKVRLSMTEESYLTQRGFAVNEIDVATLVIIDEAGNDVTKNYIVTTESGMIIVQ